MLKEGRRKTGLIIKSDKYYKVYWPHLDATHPDFEADDPETLELYTEEGWISDERLIAVYDQPKTKHDLDLWLMMHPEDVGFIKKYYPELAEGV